jgi:hypothetical protein
MESLVAKTKENQNSPERLLRRHRRWFPFVGAILLLGTFLVNDALRNESNDLADSLSRAETSFAVREEIQGIVDHLNKDDGTLRDILGAVSKSTQINPSKNRPLWDVSEELNERYPTYYRHISTFDNILNLLEKLPYDHQLDEQRWILKRRLNHLDELLSDLQKRRYYLDSGYVDEASQMLPKIKADRDIENAEVDSDKLNTIAAVDAFGEEVFRRARIVQSKADERSTLWKHLSYALYPFGVVLGLLGKLYGEADSDSE